MNESYSLLERLPEEAVWRLEEACCHFEAALQTGGRPRVEDFVAGADGAERLVRLRELLRLELYYRRRAGEGPSPKEYETRFPDAAVIVEEVFGSAAVRRSATVDDLEQTGPESPASEEGRAVVDAEATDQSALGPSAADATAGRFKVLRFHAGGGLGQVFVAEDAELHREVALKEIKKEHANRKETRGRFVLEAETTGRLEHPGIVPVYGLGTYPDGRPFYAMRFIHGESFKAAVEHFHASAPVRFDSLEFRQLLGRFAAVCQAVAYAHSRGVLHRDLKPDNIMLGKFGETLVVDWGLAKVLGGAAEGPRFADRASVAAAAGGHGDTRAGQVLGTPAFMSPEQAAGKGDEQGQATDVYGLGATLYVLLTNQAPFQGKVIEVLLQVQRGAWAPARQVNPSIPAALDAICRKAMALAPAERYASALELAADVEQWLADEPVKAYQEPAGARVRRWMRKHPRRVTAVAVLLATAVVGLTVGAALLERSKREAQDNFEMAQNEADHFLKAVGEDAFLDEPGLRPLRERLLRETVDDYVRFLATRQGDPRARQQMAEAKRQLGELYGRLDRMAEAEPLVLQAGELYEKLLEAAPADRELRFGLARVRLTRAGLEVQAGDSEQGKKELDRAIELLEGLRAEEPRNIEDRSLLARGYDLRAMAEADCGSLEAAIADNQRAVEMLLDPTAQDSREDEQSSYLLENESPPGLPPGASQKAIREAIPLRGQVFGRRGALLNMSGRTSESARELWTAALVQRFCVRAAPRIRQNQVRLALVLLEAGRVEVELGRPAKGESALREAFQIVRKLRQDDPSVPEYRAVLAQAAGRLGEDLFAQGRTTAAADQLREAVQLGDELLKKGKNRALQTCHARTLYVLGCLEAESGGLAQGLRDCTRAGKEQEQALAEARENPSLRSDLLGTQEVLARLRFLGGEIHHADWTSAQRRILAERQALAKERPAARFRGEVAASAAVLAALLLEEGRPEEAAALVDDVLPDHERLVREEDRLSEDPPAEPQGRVSPPMFLPGGQREDVWRLGSDAVRLGEKPPRPSDRQLRRQWALLLARRSAALARLGRGGEAVEADRQAVAMTEGLLRGDREWRCPPASPASAWSFLAQELSYQEPCYRYDLACYLALASTLPRNEGLSDPANQAVQALRDAIASGFDNPRKLLTDPALEPLRKRDDFQKLVGDLEQRVRDQGIPRN